MPSRSPVAASPHKSNAQGQQLGARFTVIVISVCTVATDRCFIVSVAVGGGAGRSQVRVSGLGGGI